MPQAEKKAARGDTTLTIALARLVCGHALPAAKAAKVVAAYAEGEQAAEIADHVTAEVVTDSEGGSD